MREIIALSVFFILTGLVIFLVLKKHIGNGLTAILLAFALISGWSIANYDWMRSVRWEVPGIQPFEDKVQSIKREAISAIEEESNARRKALAAMIEDVKSASQNLEEKKKMDETLIQAAKKLDDGLKVQEQRMRELQGLAENTKEQMIAVHDATANLALVLTRLIYLQLETKGEPGNEREMRVKQEILDSLDHVVGMAIPNPEEREKFISEVKNLVPAPQ
jgi:hypothetical protein